MDQLAKDVRATSKNNNFPSVDAQLLPEVFKRIDATLGGSMGFDTDLMACPSNVQTGNSGRKLELFSQNPAPGFSGVNVVVQNVENRNSYHFDYSHPLLHLLYNKRLV